MVFGKCFIFLVLPAVILSQTAVSNPPKTFNEISSALKLVVDDAAKEVANPMVAYERIISNSSALANIILKQKNCEKTTVEEFKKKSLFELLGLVGSGIVEMFKEGGPQIVILLGALSKIFGPKPAEPQKE